MFTSWYYFFDIFVFIYFILYIYFGNYKLQREQKRNQIMTLIQDYNYT